jgi:DNA processing protein
MFEQGAVMTKMRREVLNDQRRWSAAYPAGASLGSKVTDPITAKEACGPYTDGMRTVSRGDRIALLAFTRNRPRSVKVPEITAALLEYSDVRAALATFQPESLFDQPADDEQLRAAADLLDEWEADGLTVLTLLDDDYPAALRDIHEAPPVIFARGELRRGDVGVSVVGSRAASSTGLEIAGSVASALAAEGFTTISGLAAGVDAAAHSAALAAGGRTVAVIGTGHHVSYPASNRELQAEIATRGLLLSQFWPDAPPRPAHFPIRNATMSGLGIATFVAEAGEKSGARIQARKAVEHGRPVILSDLVVRNNRWAQELLGRPNVWEATSVDDVIALVRKLDSARSRIDDVLRSLASTA